MLREIDINRNIEQEPLKNAGAVSGFISPAEDYKERRLHIAQRIVNDPINTFYFEVSGDDMADFGIISGTLLIVDRTKAIQNGSLIICNIEGQWLNRYLYKKNNRVFLYSSKNKKPLEITNQSIEIFGAVTWHCIPHTV